MWFEHVPSEANLADEPSRRLELARARWEILPGVWSEPIPCVFPLAAWLDDPAGWLHAAAALADAA